MSTTTRIVQSSKGIVHTHPFLQWVCGTLGSPKDTRGIRLTWEGLGNRELKAQLRFTNPTLGKTKTLNFPGLVQGQKKYSFETHFKESESQEILDTLLKSVWTLDGCNMTAGFVRQVPELKEESIIVEFGSPNIAKPLHMGHMRSHVTGHFVARICKAVGHPTKNICFLGDWGTQFGILQAALAKFLPESQSQDLPSTLEQLPLSELLRYYVQGIQEKENNESFFQQALHLSALLEQGDSKGIQVWKTIRNKTISHLQEFWSLLNINFDVIQGESEFRVQNSITEKAVQDLKNLGLILVGEDGCTYVVLQNDEKFQNTQNIPLIKTDGTSLYLLRDIACAIARKEMYKYDRMIYIVDKTQSHHFISLFRILEEIGVQQHKYSQDGWDKKLWHVSFGKVEGMSTRTGNFVLLSDVISTGSTLMQKNRLKSPNVRDPGNSCDIATQLAISALVVNYLKIRRNRDVCFNWDEALQPTGDTGVNLQYTHARLMSLENKIQEASQTIFAACQEYQAIDIKYILREPLALDLVVHLLNFEDAVWSSYADLEPCILLHYLFRLGDKVSKALKHLKVLQEEDKDIAATRAALFMLSRKVCTLGLNMIGVQALNQL